jgi:hypothetical protein
MMLGGGGFHLLAIRACATVIALAVLLQGFELWSLRRHFGSSGIWRWSILKREYGLLSKVFGLFLGDRAFPVLILIQILLALALLELPFEPGQSGSMLPLALSPVVLLGSMRFRGTFNGGSDCMTLVVLLSVTGACTAGLSETACRVALGYIAAQTVLSYAVAGWVKLKEPAWRSGEALPLFLSMPQHAVPEMVRGWASVPRVARLTCWGVITGELALAAVTTALAFWPGRHPDGLVILALALLALGLVFHLVNAWVLGLNRFFWAWLSAYPAVLYWVI